MIQITAGNRLSCWYAVFLLFYASMARMQWDRRDVVNRVTAVAFAAAGAVVLLVVFGTDLYTLVRGAASVVHPNTWTQSMAFAGPDSPPLIPASAVSGALNLSKPVDETVAGVGVDGEVADVAGGEVLEEVAAL